jgi:hypothetical protein
VPDALEKFERLMDKVYRRDTGSRGRPGRFAVEGA